MNHAIARAVAAASALAAIAGLVAAQPPARTPGDSVRLMRKPRTADVQFVNSTAKFGMEYTLHDCKETPGLWPGQNTRFGSGVSAIDFNKDGRQDFYICDSYMHEGHLLRANADGTYTDVGREAGVQNLGLAHMALAVDLDNDGYDDLVILNDSSRYTNEFPRSVIYRNNRDGTFTNVTIGSGFTPEDLTFGGMTAGDYDKDGDLDLFVGGWYEYSAHLFRNDGGFKFTDVSGPANIHVPGNRSHWTPVFADFDNDGWQDIFAAVDFDEDYLLRNNRDGTFTDVSHAAGITHVYNDMGAAVADFDNDLDLDIYTTNITNFSNCTVPWGCNMLYKNNGDGTFTDGTREHGVGNTAWGWGDAFADIDLDGHLDLIAVGGWYVGEEQRTCLFMNDGQNNFHDAAAEAGVQQFADKKGLLVVDIEKDGDLDMIVTEVRGPVTVWENVTPRSGRNYLTVEAEGTTSNRNGVGARVYITVGDKMQMAEIIAGGSFYTSPPKEAHFGLGTVAVINQLVVIFPSGKSVEMRDIAANQRLHVVEPE
ncbi:MAG: CRTAC1 family protein [Phycisphaerales bacterium]|nr:CRTAC1 family protein [Phycisphaerales bacterium]